MSSVSTIVIDRNRLFRAGLKSLLVDEIFGSVVEASSVAEMQAEVESGSVPELIVVEMSGEQGTSANYLQQIRGAVPAAKIVVMADSLNPDSLVESFAAGADGFLLKDISCESLVESLRLVLIGEKVFPSRLATLILNGGGRLTAQPRSTVKLNDYNLSDREVEILRCLIEGHSNKVIANNLHITEATVKVHLKSILRKINASNRTQAAIWAMNHGLGALASSGSQSEGQQGELLAVG